MLSVERLRYLGCLYPLITSLRTNHKLSYRVLYINHEELVCISDHMISVCTCTRIPAQTLLAHGAMYMARAIEREKQALEKLIFFDQ